MLFVCLICRNSFYVKKINPLSFFLIYQCFDCIYDFFQKFIFNIYIIRSFSVFFYGFWSPELFFLLGRALWHAGSQFPDQGSNPYPLQWNNGVLTTGPPGKSLEPRTLFFFLIYLINLFLAVLGLHCWAGFLQLQ